MSCCPRARADSAPVAVVVSSRRRIPLVPNKCHYTSHLLRQRTFHDLPVRNGPAIARYVATGDRYCVTVQQHVAEPNVAR